MSLNDSATRLAAEAVTMAQFAKWEAIARGEVDISEHEFMFVPL